MSAVAAGGSREVWPKCCCLRIRSTSSFLQPISLYGFMSAPVDKREGLQSWGVLRHLVCWGLTVASLSFSPGCDPSERLYLLDLAGQQVNPLDPGKAQVTVFLFTRSDCPVSNRYAPEVRRLWEKFAPLGVVFWLVYPDPAESVATIRQHVKDYEYPCAALRDPQHTLVQWTEARVTPEAAVFRPGGKLVYRGRINNRFVDLGKTRAEATRHDLAEALEATLAGRPVPNERTPAVGCFIEKLP